MAMALQHLQDGSVHKQETHLALVEFQRWHYATLFMGGAGRAAVAGGGGGEGERPWQ